MMFEMLGRGQMAYLDPCAPLDTLLTWQSWAAWEVFFGTFLHLHGGLSPALGPDICLWMTLAATSLFWDHSLSSYSCGRYLG